jgi:hypothetical protein
MNETDDGTLRDSEIALMDTLKLIFEVIIAKGISKPETLSEALRQQALVYPPEAMPRAIFVVEQLQASMNDPYRKELRELLARPIAGSA